VPDADLLAKLQAENARLIAFLDAHGIDRHPPVEPVKILKLSARSSSTLTARLLYSETCFVVGVTCIPTVGKAKQVSQDTHLPAENRMADSL
jgi:hypothetical protein